MRLLLILAFYIFITPFANSQWGNAYNFLDDIELAFGNCLLDENNGFIVGCSNCFDFLNPSYGVILKTSNGGETYSVVESIENATFRDIVFVDQNTGYACGNISYRGIVMKTIDGGITWNTPSDAYIGGLRSMYFLNAMTGYAVGDYVYRTNNGGESWTQLSQLEWSNYSDVFFLNEEVGFVISGSESSSFGEVYRTIDGGQTWESEFIADGSGGHLSIMFITNKLGFIASTSGVFRTTDGGTTWSLTSLDGIYTDVHFTDPVYGYLCGYRGAEIVIYQTTDAGGTWEESYHMPGITLYSIDAYDNEHIAVCGAGHHIETFNGGGLIGNYVSAYIEGTGTICPGNDVDIQFEFSGEPPFDLIYTNGVQNFNLTTSSYTHQLSANISEDTEYHITTFSDNSGSSSHIGGAAIYMVNPPPTAHISGDSTICSGDTFNVSLSLTGTAPWAIELDQNDHTNQISNITAEDTILTFTLNETSTFNLTGVIDFCASGYATGEARATVSLEPSSSDQFKISPSDNFICNGDSIQLSCSTEEGVPFSWLLPSGEEYFTDSLWTSKHGEYILQSLCGNARDTLNLTFESFEGNLINPTSNSICDRDTVVLFATEEGLYTWSDGSHSNQIEVREPGLYSLSMIDTNNCVKSQPIEITKPWFVPGLSASRKILECPDYPEILLQSANTYDDKWVSFEERIPKSGFYSIADIEFVNERVGFAILNNHYRLYQTKDGGYTWDEVFTGTQNYKLFNLYFVNDSIGFFQHTNQLSSLDYPYSSSFDLDNTLFKTIDGGLSWDSVCHFNRLGYMDFYDENNGFFVYGDSNIYRTYDGGLSWDNRSQPFGGNRNIGAVKMVSEDIVFVAGNSRIYKSYDQGLTWNSSNTYLPNGWQHDEYYKGVCFSIDFVNENIGYLAFSAGTVWKTTDGGDKWFEIAELDFVDRRNIYFNSKQVQFSSPDTGFVERYRTTDGGRTWVNYMDATSSISKIIDINGDLVLEADGSILYKLNNLKYKWYRDGQTIDAPGIDALNVNIPGNYYLEATGGDCSCRSDVYAIEQSNNTITGDINCNGIIDEPSEIAGDTNLDGIINNGELVGDSNGNGIIDASEVAGDSNGDGILSVEENTNKSSTVESNIRIAPVPVDDKLHITINGDQSCVNIQVVTLTGQVMISEKHWDNNNLEIDFSAFINGTYIIQVNTDTKTASFVVPKL